MGFYLISFFLYPFLSFITLARYRKRGRGVSLRIALCYLKC